MGERVVGMASGDRSLAFKAYHLVRARATFECRLARDRRASSVELVMRRPLSPG